MYFSYDKSSDANIYPIPAAEVVEIIKMNRNGIKPESLRHDVKAPAPEFVTAVGDDSISRFDTPKRKKNGRGGKSRGNKKGGNGASGGGNQGRRNRGEKK